MEQGFIGRKHPSEVGGGEGIVSEDDFPFDVEKRVEREAAEAGADRDGSGANAEAVGRGAVILGPPSGGEDGKSGGAERDGALLQEGVDLWCGEERSAVGRDAGGGVGGEFGGDDGSLAEGGEEEARFGGRERGEEFWGEGGGFG